MRWRSRPGASWNSAAHARARASARSPPGRTDSRRTGPATRGGFSVSETPITGTRCGEQPLDLDGEPPALGRARLEQRERARGAQRLAAARREQRRRAAVQHRLRGGHRDDEIGLDERRVDAERTLPACAELDEVVGLGVVDDHAAPEAPAELGRHEQADLARRRPPQQAARDEDRHLRDAEPLELVDDGRDRVVPRPVLRRRDRQRRLLDHDRRGAAARDEPLERLARERKARAPRAPPAGRRRAPRAAAAAGGRRRRRPARRRRSASRRAAGCASRAAPVRPPRVIPSATKMPPVEPAPDARAARRLRAQAAGERVGERARRRSRESSRDRDEQQRRGTRPAAQPGRGPGRRTAAGTRGRTARSSG